MDSYIYKHNFGDETFVNSKIQSFISFAVRSRNNFCEYACLCIAVVVSKRGFLLKLKANDVLCHFKILLYLNKPLIVYVVKGFNVLGN